MTDAQIADAEYACTDVGQPGEHTRASDPTSNSSSRPSGGRNFKLQASRVYRPVLEHVKYGCIHTELSPLN